MAVTSFSKPFTLREFDSDRIVATLSSLGVTYISVQEAAEPYESLPPEQLIAALLESNDARIEYALVALLIRCPDYAEVIPPLTGALPLERAKQLKRHYTAAVYLQKMYWPALSIYLGSMTALPDYFSAQLGLPEPDDYYGVIGLKELVGQLPPPIDWWETYLYPVRMLIRFLSLEKTYAREEN